MPRGISNTPTSCPIYHSPILTFRVVPFSFVPNLRFLSQSLKENPSHRPSGLSDIILKIISRRDYMTLLEQSKDKESEGLEELKLMYSFLRSDPSLWTSFNKHPLFQSNSFVTSALSTYDFLDVNVDPIYSIKTSKSWFWMLDLLQLHKFS